MSVVDVRWKFLSREVARCADRYLEVTDPDPECRGNEETQRAARRELVYVLNQWNEAFPDGEIHIDGE